MPTLANLTDEECNFVFEVLKREESRGQLPLGERRGDDMSADQDMRRTILKDLLWRLQVVRSSRNRGDEEANDALVAEGLAGYY